MADRCSRVSLLGFVGGLIGVPLYAIGGTGSSQYVGTVDIDEETFEHEFADLGLLRNPITAYKIKADGREQEGCRSRATVPNCPPARGHRH